MRRLFLGETGVRRGFTGNILTTTRGRFFRKTRVASVAWYHEGMKLIIGVGNPGEKFAGNRHNVGKQFVEKIRETDWAQEKGKVLVLTSDRYMNNSGEFVKESSLYYKIAPKDIYIVHDDLDIRLGEYKIQLGVGPKVHNGVNSIETMLGATEFWRIRIGVDNREGVSREAGESYVLKDFSLEEREMLESVFDRIAQELETRVGEKNDNK